MNVCTRLPFLNVQVHPGLSRPVPSSDDKEPNLSWLQGAMQVREFKKNVPRSVPTGLKQSKPALNGHQTAATATFQGF